uniref:Secreted protein n=1 Tax=Ditylenchus dipsaci TaxID=166011 RepID=A0A915DZH7_9BILA
MKMLPFLVLYECLELVLVFQADDVCVESQPALVVEPDEVILDEGLSIGLTAVTRLEEVQLLELFELTKLDKSPPLMSQSEK